MLPKEGQYSRSGKERQPQGVCKITDKEEPPRKKSQATRKAMDKGMNVSKIKET